MDVCCLRDWQGHGSGSGTLRGKGHGGHAHTGWPEHSGARGTPPAYHHTHTTTHTTTHTPTTDMVTYLRGPSPWPVTLPHPPLFHLSHCALIPSLHSLSSEVSTSLSTPLLCSPPSSVVSPHPALRLHHWVRCEEQLSSGSFTSDPHQFVWQGCRKLNLLCHAVIHKGWRRWRDSIIMTSHNRPLIWHCSLTLSWEYV